MKEKLQDYMALIQRQYIDGELRDLKNTKVSQANNIYFQ
jgi:hypothetical protein